MPKGNIVLETIPLKVRIESQPDWDRRTFSIKVLNYMKSGTMNKARYTASGAPKYLYKRVNEKA